MRTGVILAACAAGVLVGGCGDSETTTVTETTTSSAAISSTTVPTTSVPEPTYLAEMYKRDERVLDSARGSTGDDFTDFEVREVKLAGESYPDSIQVWLFDSALGGKPAELSIEVPEGAESFSGTVGLLPESAARGSFDVSLEGAPEDPFSAALEVNGPGKRFALDVEGLSEVTLQISQTAPADSVYPFVVFADAGFDLDQ